MISATAHDPQHTCPPKPWRRRNSFFTKAPSDALDHVNSEMAIGSKFGLDVTKKLPGEGFKCPWPPRIKMDEVAKAQVEKLFGLGR